MLKAVFLCLFILSIPLRSLNIDELCKRAVMNLISIYTQEDNKQKKLHWERKLNYCKKYSDFSLTLTKDDIHRLENSDEKQAVTELSKLLLSRDENDAQRLFPSLKGNA
jgi:hypothetical protein